MDSVEQCTARTCYKSSLYRYDCWHAYGGVTKTNMRGTGNSRKRAPSLVVASSKRRQMANIKRPEAVQEQCASNSGKRWGGTTPRDSKTFGGASVIQTVHAPSIPCNGAGTRLSPPGILKLPSFIFPIFSDEDGGKQKKVRPASRRGVQSISKKLSKDIISFR